MGSTHQCTSFAIVHFETRLPVLVGFPTVGHIFGYLISLRCFRLSYLSKLAVLVLPGELPSGFIV